jgi:hypothetical protein
MLWMWQKERRKPLSSKSFENRISEELLSNWHQSLYGNIQGKKGDEADNGINHLIARLLPLESNAFLIDRLRVSDTNLIDVIMIGPKGIWIFDVIHINGVIRWKDGVWTRSRSLQKDEQMGTRPTPGLKLFGTTGRAMLLGLLKETSRKS